MSNLNNETIKDINKLIDEQFRPSMDSGVYLEEMVAKQMRAEGYDPLNKDDVKKYWASKGVESNG